MKNVKLCGLCLHVLALYDHVVVLQTRDAVDEARGKNVSKQLNHSS